jgi:hypothetical protein
MGNKIDIFSNHHYFLLIEKTFTVHTALRKYYFVITDWYMIIV